MRRRRSTEDIELLIRAIRNECAELLDDLVRLQTFNVTVTVPGTNPPAITTLRVPPPPPMPMSDPGTGPGFTRRGQAKHDLAHWRREHDRLMNRLADRLLPHAQRAQETPPGATGVVREVCATEYSRKPWQRDGNRNDPVNPTQRP